MPSLGDSNDPTVRAEHDAHAPLLAPIASLFDQARDAAASGDYGKKEEIYRTILGRPDATLVDRFRVETYFADLVRRHGKPDEAQSMLELLTLPDKPYPFFAEAEYWQALGQCQFMRQEFDAALVTMRNILSVEAFDELPIDKRLYHLESGLAIKLALRQLDPETSNWFGLYDRLASEPTLTGPIGERARALRHDLGGDLAILQEAPQSALSHFRKCFDCAPAVRNKVVAACKALSLMYSANVETQRQAEFETFVRANWGVLLPTDLAGIPALREVQSRIILE